MHIYTNNGTEFTSNISEEFCTKLGIALHHSPRHSPHRNGSCEGNHYTVDRQFEKNVNDAKGTKTLKQSFAEAVFAANTNIRVRKGFSPTQVLLGRQPLLPAYMRTKENTPNDACEALLQIHKVMEYSRIATERKLEDIQANRIAKYQFWKYSAEDLVDFFENTVNPKRIWGTIVQSKNCLTPSTKSGTMELTTQR